MILQIIHKIRSVKLVRLSTRKSGIRCNVPDASIEAKLALKNNPVFCTDAVKDSV